MQISKDLLDLSLPTFIVNHFTFISSSSDQDNLHLYVEEKNDTSIFKDRKVGRVKTDEKSNEITVIPNLLDILDVSGSVVSIDAMRTQ